MYLPSDKKKKIGEKQLKNRSKTIGKVRDSNEIYSAVQFLQESDCL